MIQRDYLIIGAGIGGASVCQTLREYDQKGSVTLVGNEAILPYYRPRLFASLLADKAPPTVSAPTAPELEKILHLAPQWYSDNRIELRLDTLVTQFNIERRLAVLSTGQVIEFRKACLATGSRPRRLQVAGANLGKVLTLRTMRDVLALREIASEEKSIVIIGGGFIAAEAAAALRAMGLEVQIMSRHPYLWQEMLDTETARWLTDYYEGRGVTLLNETLNGFEGKTVLRNIQAKSGNRIHAGVAVIAAGVDLNLGLVLNTPLASPNGTPVNEYLETDEKGIYAVGDIALYPDPIFGGVRHTAHWETTLEQAHIAGGNITGKKRQKFKALPCHTSTVFDLNFEFIGDFRQTPVRFEIEGDRSKRQFSARYYQGSKLMGMLLCNQPTEVSTEAKQELLLAHKR
jgi:NADPH-dependent 2,4-dienoyl-CoA reductase/sulfur reductase-like enzyme